MNYAYYPGCSLTESACEYDRSTRAVLALLGATLEEIPDWNCCGASAVEAVSALLTSSLPARNLAQAQQALPGQDILVPCSACYLNLLKARRHMLDDSRLRNQVNEVLSADGKRWRHDLPGAKPRHLLDVLITDFGTEAIAQLVSRPLEGMVVAPYYGCQILRPYPVFDDPEHPRSMHRIIQALGATPLDWRGAAHCCGASLMATRREVAVSAVAAILDEARKAGAQAVITVCPMCQMNLEGYQRAASRALGEDASMTALYLPQLMGLAMGLSEEDVLLSKNLAVAQEFLNHLRTNREPSTSESPEATPA